MVAYSPLGGQFNGVQCYKLLSQDEQLQSICKKHGKSVAQVVLAWHSQKWPQKYAFIPKASSGSHMKDNLLASDIKLSPDEMAYINTLDKKQRSCCPISLFGLSLFE